MNRILILDIYLIGLSDYSEIVNCREIEWNFERNMEPRDA